MLKRKIDTFLEEWRKRPNHKPLIVSGARQVGKTTSIENFGRSYQSFIEINFLLDPSAKDIFQDGYEVDSILRNLSLHKRGIRLIPNHTLILFDEIQAYPDATTSLKSFALDGRYDVICSGSLLGISYRHISSVAVGFKEEVTMYPLDFEEFLWAEGYTSEQIEDLYQSMKELKPLSPLVMKTYQKSFEDYLYCGGMPFMVDTFQKEKNFSSVFPLQKQLFKDYKDDISKYVEGLDSARVLNVYRHIAPQLAKPNHKFQITKLGHGARSREYFGCNDWLQDAGIINIAENLTALALPFSSYEKSKDYRIYFAEHSLLNATLDEEVQDRFYQKQDFSIYHGAVYESIVSEALVRQGYPLYYYRSEDGSVELDFLIRVKDEIVPLEVKAKEGRTRSLNTVIADSKTPIHHGVKLTDQNIGYDGTKFTFPLFLTFLLKRFFKETNYL